MSAELLVREFSRLLEGTGAIARVRRLLLDMAVRGRLVAQNATDGTADSLINAILAQPREVQLRPAHRDLIDQPIVVPPFEVPSAWAWTRLGRVTDHIQRGKSPTYSGDGGPLVVSQKCVRWEGLDLAPAKSITAASLAKYAPSQFLRDQDLLWNSTGTGTIGRVSRVESPPRQLVCDSHVTVVRCSRLDAEYVRCWLRSDHVYGRIERDASGSTNQVELTLQMALGMPIPLPPLAEQRRIVAKVHQILALCGKLEAAQKEREARRDLLRTTSLHNLITGESKDHVRFYLSHSPRMFTKPEHVEGLRQAILDLAVLGRLVRQDPADEPIRMALDAALARRAALVRTKAVRSKGVDGRSPLVDGVDLPNSWTTERLGNLVDPENTISYGVLVPGDHVPDGVPLVRAQDLSITTAPTRPTKSIARDIEKAYRRTRLRGGEILLCVVGSIGKLGVAPASWAGANIARAVARIDPLPEISSTYLLIALRSRMVQDYFQTTTRTLAQPTLNVGLIELTPIPVPPRAEQDRIVAKADQLLAVCDELEQSLAAEQAERTRLLEALLDTALRVAPREGAMAAV